MNLSDERNRLATSPMRVRQELLLEFRFVSYHREESIRPNEGSLESLAVLELSGVVKSRVLRHFPGEINRVMVKRQRSAANVGSVMPFMLA